MSTKKDIALLPQASPDLQIRASHETLTMLLLSRSSCFANTRKTITHFTRLLMNISISPECRKDPVLAEEIVRFVVVLLDLFVLDEMQARNKEKPGGMVYGRAGMLFDDDYRKCIFPYEMSDQPLSILLKRNIRYHYAFCSEMRVYFETLAASRSLRSFSTPEELDRHLKKRKTDSFEVVYFNRRLSADEINTTVCHIINHKKILLVIPFCIDGRMGGFALAGNYVVKNDEHLFLPQSEPSHHDVLETLLRGGLPLIHLKSSGKHKPKDVPVGSLELSRQEAENELKGIWREISTNIAPADSSRRITVEQALPYIFMKGEESGSYIKSRMSQLEHGYRKLLLRDPGEKRSFMYFTRTGLSATTLGVYTAKEFYKQVSHQPLLYVNPGFYYEADILVKRQFAATADFRQPDVRIFCINISSNPPFTTIDSENTYADLRDSLIRYVLSRAAKDSRHHYFLIVDKTTDLFFQTIPLNSRLPSNLHLFEIASLTKFRRGDHNHFSGVAIYKGSPALLPFVSKGLEKSHSILSEREKFFIHLLTPDEVKKTVMLQKRQAEAFLSSFDMNMQALPPQLRWRIERNPDSPQYVFLIPPMRAIIQASVARYPQPFFRKSAKTDGPTKIYRCHKLFIKKLIHSAFKPFYTTPGFERGSSFGLEATRATLIPGNFTYRGRLFSQKLLRISFGLQTSLISLDVFANLLTAQLIGVTVKKVTAPTISILRSGEQSETRHFVLRMLKSYGYLYDPKYHFDLDNLKKNYGTDKGIFYVLKNGKRICGTIAVALTGKQAQLKRFYIDPQFRGQGYGSQLMDEAILFCRKNNCTVINIQSERVFRRAHALYKRKGFIEINQDRKCYFFEKNMHE